MDKSFANQNLRNYGSTSDMPSVDFMGSQLSPTELNHLCESITTNIYTINTSWRNLDRANKTIGTPRDNQSVRDQVHLTQLSCNQIITKTTRDLQHLNVLSRKGDKQQKLQVEKLTSDFKEALQCYSRLQQQVAEKMKINLLNKSLSRTYSEEDENKLLEEQEAIIKQKALQSNIEFENEMLLEREQNIRKIEVDILDVNQIMRDLSALVHVQAETVDSIENQIDSTCGNVELGREQLQKASQYQAKYRRKLCILIGFAVIIVIILSVILAVKLK